MFGLKMDSIKSLETKLDEFKKLTIDFENICETSSAESQVVILLDC